MPTYYLLEQSFVNKGALKRHIKKIINSVPDNQELEFESLKKMLYFLSADTDRKFLLGNPIKGISPIKNNSQLRIIYADGPCIDIDIKSAMTNIGKDVEMENHYYRRGMAFRAGWLAVKDLISDARASIKGDGFLDHYPCSLAQLFVDAMCSTCKLPASVKVDECGLISEQWLIEYWQEKYVKTSRYQLVKSTADIHWFKHWFAPIG